MPCITPRDHCIAISQIHPLYRQDARVHLYQQ